MKVIAKTEHGSSKWGLGGGGREQDREPVSMKGTGNSLVWLRLVMDNSEDQG